MAALRKDPFVIGPYFAAPTSRSVKEARLFIYLATFIVFSTIAVLRLWEREDQIVIPVLCGVFITVFVGYRYQIGVDWTTYETIFLDNVRSSLLDALKQGDSAYSFTNWIVGRAGGQIWHVNLICAALFSYGLIQLCRILPRPGLALAVAVPNLVIITAMGYTRQAVAVGCIMLACHHFRGVFHWKWIGWLCLALFFHKSAFLVFPAFLLASNKHRWVSIVVGGVLAFAALLLIVSSGLNDILSLYLEGDIDSSGALPRILVCSSGGVAFLLIKDRQALFVDRSKLFRNMAMMMVALLPLYFLVPSRTIMDRIGVLLIPMQSVAYAGLAASFAMRNRHLELPFTMMVIAAYGGQMLVWFLYATFASYWIPYSNILWVKWI